ncbi:PEP-CTERM sorting domain-containing protein [Aliiglaciecola sp. 3_MG-2023]|uniref:PEP-CTERM sorting domain-containing protein n=1 Tax=Aliiglaciecola sp. 3_MG-2023 TaxID=3062644 RepID=UPI0026E3BC08|nr:PEP-CTERM sorting domain-containing protein [Aliiglaciecola sp. 3_MG-2023]MDO6693560.1 PEP-CTERM sorting domain-containing protein [Aliiglaciecola sp. 3_MG-2023]
MNKVLLTLALLFVGTANASLIYNVERVIGAGGVTGSITTDGFLGTLATNNIIDWDLTLNDGSNTFNLIGPGNVGTNSDLLINGSSLTATNTDLLFDFSGVGLVLFQNPFTGSGINFWCVEGVNSACASSGSSTESLYLSSMSYVVNSGVVSIASTSSQSVPEPLSLALLCMGLFGLRFSTKRK